MILFPAKLNHENTTELVLNPFVYKQLFYILYDNPCEQVYYLLGRFPFFFSEKPGNRP